jgi:hypothetical protein
MKALSSLKNNLRRMLLLRPLIIRKIRPKVTERLVSMKTNQSLILFRLLSTTTVVMKMFSSLLRKAINLLKRRIQSLLLRLLSKPQLSKQMNQLGPLKNEPKITTRISIQTKITIETISPIEAFRIITSSKITLKRDRTTTMPIERSKILRSI